MAIPELETENIWGGWEEIVPLGAIDATDRIRKDLGDIGGLVSSIKEFGIIQPIVLSKEYVGGMSPVIKLVAGGRRFAALKQLGIADLVHGREFVWRNENRDVHDSKTQLRFSAIELEENLRRKDLSWPEIVEGKAKLLKIMQEIYGEQKMGGPSKSTAQTQIPNSTGFGVRKLAAMLGESPATISRDLQIAAAIKMFPQMSTFDTKEAAVRKLSTATNIATNLSKPSAIAGLEHDWKLYKGKFEDHVHEIPNESIDLIYTDLPFGVDLNKMSGHASQGIVSYPDSREKIVSNLANISVESFRILKPNTFCVFFFGFNYYTELVSSLKAAGFIVNPVPFIWYKHTRSTENPNIRYANAYDAAIVAGKGSPMFVRPGQPNVVDIPAVPPSQKLQIAQQPLDLVTKFILDMTAEGMTICDLAAGSGTTGVASLKNKRKVVMFEKEPQAWPVIESRMNSLT
jgi:DNA modification methylase